MEIYFFPVITLKRSKVTWGFRIYIRLKSIKYVRILNQENKQTKKHFNISFMQTAYKKEKLADPVSQEGTLKFFTLSCLL